MVWLPKTERGRSAGEFSSKTCARRAEGLETVGCQCAIITIHTGSGAYHPAPGSERSVRVKGRC